MNINSKELDCFMVSNNHWVIRRTYRDEQGRKCHQFIADLASANVNNKELAENFIKGIAALEQEEEKKNINYGTSGLPVIYKTPKGSIPPILQFESDEETK